MEDLPAPDVFAKRQLDGNVDDQKAKQQKTEGIVQENQVSSCRDPVMFHAQVERYLSAGRIKDHTYVKLHDYMMGETTNKLRFYRKGISMNLMQWNHIKELIPYMDRAIQKLETANQGHGQGQN